MKKLKHKVNLELGLMTQKTKKWYSQQRKIYDEIFYLMRYVVGFRSDEYEEIVKRLEKGLKFCEDFYQGKVSEEGNKIE